MKTRLFSLLAPAAILFAFFHVGAARAHGIGTVWRHYLAGKHASFSQFSAQQGQFSGALDFYFCQDGNFVGTNSGRSSGSGAGPRIERGLWSVTSTDTDLVSRALLHITYDDNRIVPDNFHLFYDPAANSVALDGVTAVNFQYDESPCLRSLPPFFSHP